MLMSEIAKELVGTLKGFVTAEVDRFTKGPLAAFTNRLDAFEETVKGMLARAPEKGEPGLPGKDAPAPTAEQLKAAWCELMKDAAHRRPLIEILQDFYDAELKSLPSPKDGAPGVDGKDGRDALDIDVLPGIDLDKSVSRGTYATHNGGLWRATAKTKGMRGWECVVDGIATLEVKQTGERGFAVVISRSSGEVVEKALELPVMIYRGVYKPATEYVKGDTVTRDGGLWHCNVEKTTETPGSGSKDWTLAAKRGRDGADGKNGAPGKEGKSVDVEVPRPGEMKVPR